MTQDEIIEMADQCNIDPYDLCADPKIGRNNLETFAKLIAAKERELCAELCANFYDPAYKKYDEAGNELAAAIRARGSQDGE